MSRTLVLLALCLSPAALLAQGAPVPARIPSGAYRVVPDPTAALGVDVSAFVLRFEGDSSLVVEQGGMLLTRARVQVAGDEVTWTDLDGQMVCPGQARYKLTLSDDRRTLRLTPVTDGCAERSMVVSQVSLVRQP